jgi:2-dehydropantoate 2-reductase
MTLPRWPLGQAPSTALHPGLPRVCVIGAGAIGGYFGVSLGQHHADVSVIARGATLEALRARGWVLQSGSRRIAVPVRAAAEARDLGPQDIVLIAVKAYAVCDVAPLVAPLLEPQTLVIPALNGVPWWFPAAGPRMSALEALESVDPGGTIAATIPAGQVIGAVVYPACSSPEPGVTVHASGSRLVFGDVAEATGGISPRVSALVDWLRSAGLDAHATADIRSEVWRKLLGNACFNPVSLLTGVTTDRLIDDPGIYRLFAAMMAETLAVGRAVGLELAVDVADRIAQTRKLGNVKTSMLQDALAHRRVELEAILGAVTEIAGRLAVPVPTSAGVLALARMRSRAILGQGG